MRTITALIAVAAAFAVTVAPASARSVKYVGKSTSGHKVTFTLKNGRIHDLTAGIRTSCLSIQGGGAPLGGPEIFGFTGSLPLKAHNRYKQTIDRLKALATRYYSSNALAARKDAARYKDNEWVKKSVMRLTGDRSDVPETKHKEQMPTSLPDTLPSQWSL